MSAVAALSLVRQVEAICGSNEIRNNSNEIVDSIVPHLQPLIVHSDTRVRLGAARALRRLAQVSGSAVGRQDLSQAKSVLLSLRDAARTSIGETTVEDKEMEKVLSTFCAEAGLRIDGDDAPQGRADSVSPSKSDRSCAQTKRGEVLVELCPPLPDSDDASAGCTAHGVEASLKSHILTAVVKVAGVVSASFESEQRCLMYTRSRRIATDKIVQADIVETILAAVSYSSVVQGTAPWKVVVLACTGEQDISESPLSARNSGYLEPADGSVSPGAAALLSHTPRGMPSSFMRSMSQRSTAEEENVTYLDDKEAKYLDEQADSKQHPSPRPRAGSDMSVPASPRQQAKIDEPAWSFFGDATFLYSWQKVKEFDADPTISARLRKVQDRNKRLEEQERSRIGRLLSALSLWPTRADGDDNWRR